MKNKLFILVSMIVLLVACTPEKDMGDYNNEENTVDSYHDETNTEDSGVDENNTVDDMMNVEKYHKTEATTLDQVNVLELLQMNLGEVIDLLGTDYSGPILGLYGAVITYEGSCTIRYIDEGLTIEKIDDNYIPELDLQAQVYGIIIYQEVVVYKGISVGKTLDEINSNPGLLRQLEVEISELDDTLWANGFIEFNSVYIGMVLTFNEDMICTMINMSKAESPHDNPIVEDRLL